MEDERTSIAVDLVAEGAGAHGGIARYVERLQTSLHEASVNIQRTPFRYLPGAQRRTVLKAFPIGVEQRRRGAVLHIPQIMGASVLLINRMHPAVVTVHDLGALYCPEDWEMSDPLSRRLLWLSMQGMKRADHIIAVSEFTRQGLLRAGYSPDRVTTIHEGVDLDCFRPMPNAAEELTRRYGIDLTSRPVVLYVGNEFPRKNLVTLVRALGQLRRAGLRTHWVKIGAAGYPPGRVALERAIVEEGIADDVTFVARISDEDLPRFYTAAAVYIQPSVWEGFGLPVLEAMACGTPVVVSTAGSLPEVVGNAGILVEPRDAVAMANALGRVVGAPQTSSNFQSAARSRASLFAWSVAAEHTQSLYCRILR